MRDFGIGDEFGHNGRIAAGVKNSAVWSPNGEILRFRLPGAASRSLEKRRVGQRFTGIHFHSQPAEFTRLSTREHHIRPPRPALGRVKAYSIGSIAEQTAPRNRYAENGGGV